MLARINIAVQRNLLIQFSILIKKNAANKYFELVLKNVKEIPSAVDDISSDFTAEELEIFRTKKPYASGISDKLIKLVFGLT